MKKLKLKKVTLSEMPTESLDGINGGFDQSAQSHPTTTISLISIYTVSIVLSGVHCNSSSTQGPPPQNSQTSQCLCPPPQPRPSRPSRPSR